MQLIWNNMTAWQETEWQGSLVVQVELHSGIHMFTALPALFMFPAWESEWVGINVTATRY